MSHVVPPLSDFPSRFPHGTAGNQRGWPLNLPRDSQFEVDFFAVQFCISSSLAALLVRFKTGLAGIASPPPLGNMSGAPTHLLFECATGAAIFECLQTEEIGNKTKQVQESIKDLNTFGRMVRLISFSPFKNALEALQGCLDVSEGEKEFLSQVLN